MPKYLKEYLINLYGQEPIQASNTTFFGMLINQEVSLKPANYVFKNIPESEIDNYLKVELVQCFRDRKMLSYDYIPEASYISIIKTLRKMLYRDYFIYLINKASKDPFATIKSITLNFLEDKSITDIQTAYETLKKKYDRSEISIRKDIGVKWPSRNIRSNKEKVLVSV